MLQLHLLQFQSSFPTEGLLCLGSCVGADAKCQILVSLRRFWTLCWEERGPSSIESLVLTFALLLYSWPHAQQMHYHTSRPTLQKIRITLTTLSFRVRFQKTYLQVADHWHSLGSSIPESGQNPNKWRPLTKLINWGVWIALVLIQQPCQKNPIILFHNELEGILHQEFPKPNSPNSIRIVRYLHQEFPAMNFVCCLRQVFPLSPVFYWPYTISCPQYFRFSKMNFLPEPIIW